MSRGWTAAMVLAAAVVIVAAVPWTSLAEPAAAPAGDWPQFLGPNQDGISTETGWLTKWPAEGPKQLWKASVGQGYSAVSVSKGRVFTMGNEGNQDTVWCFKEDSGEVIWKQSYPCKGGDHPGPRCTPTVDGDLVYSLGYEGQLACMNAADGKAVWSHKLGEEVRAKVPQWGMASSPVVLGDHLIVDVGVVGCFDKKDGKLVWKSDAFPHSYSTPLPFKSGGKQLLACFNGAGLAILDASNGKTVATYPWKTEWQCNAPMPVVIDETTIFITSGYGAGCMLLKFDGSSLKPLYPNINKSLCSHFSTPILYKGYLYGVDGNVGKAAIKCLDPKSGQVKWTAPAGGMGSLMLADGKLIIMIDGGTLAVAEAVPDSYKELARAKVLDKTCWQYPVLANGKVFCRNHEGTLVCVSVKP